MYGPVDYCKCEFCGSDYHPNENCSCIDELECECGTGAWEMPLGGTEIDELICSQCETGSKVITGSSRSVEIAITRFVLPHPGLWPGPLDVIEKGEAYTLIEYTGVYPGGGPYYHSKKEKIYDSATD